MIPQYITDLIERYKELDEEIKKANTIKLIEIIYRDIVPIEKELKGILWATKEELENLGATYHMHRNYNEFNKCPFCERMIKLNEIIKAIEEVLK